MGHSPPSFDIVSIEYCLNGTRRGGEGSIPDTRLNSQQLSLAAMETHINDSFLADLDDLSDGDSHLDDLSDNKEDGDFDVNFYENYIENLNDSVSDILRKVDDVLQKGNNMQNDGFVLEDDPQYQLILDCNALSLDIDHQILIVHNFIRANYWLKFPELESVVHHPIDYARVVKKIGNETELTLVDMEGLLPSVVIMVVPLMASTTSGKPLSQENLNTTIAACDWALDLDQAKKKVLHFIDTRMGYISPNLSPIVGSAVAAQLMGTAGGLSALANMPASNVLLLGTKRKTLPEFSTATSQLHVGFVEQTEIFQTAPPSLRNRACQLLAAKSTLAARVDSIRGDPTGETGRALRDEILKKIDKWQESPPVETAETSTSSGF